MSFFSSCRHLTGMTPAGWLAFLLIAAALLWFASESWGRMIEARVEWDPVTEYEDGSPAVVDFYTLYVCNNPIDDRGRCQGILKLFNVPGSETMLTESYEVFEPNGTVYVRGTASIDGVAGSISNQVEIPFRAQPPKAMILRIVIPDQ